MAVIVWNEVVPVASFSTYGSKLGRALVDVEFVEEPNENPVELVAGLLLPKREPAVFVEEEPNVLALGELKDEKELFGEELVFCPKLPDELPKGLLEVLLLLEAPKGEVVVVVFEPKGLLEVLLLFPNMDDPVVEEDRPKANPPLPELFDPNISESFYF